jgi:hypothetical protein
MKVSLERQAKDKPNNILDVEERSRMISPGEYRASDRNHRSPSSKIFEGRGRSACNSGVTPLSLTTQGQLLSFMGRRVDDTALPHPIPKIHICTHPYRERTNDDDQLTGLRNELWR